MPVTPLLDDFNRANETPASGWVDLNDPSRVVSNQFALSSGSVVVSYFDRQFPAGKELEVYCSIATKPGTAGIASVSLLKDISAIGAIDGYEGRLTVGAGGTDDTWKIFQVDNGVASEIATATQEAASGNGIWLEYKNGVLSLYRSSGGTWSLMTSVTDTTYQGQLQYLSATMGGATVRLDDFGGGLLPRGPKPLLVRTHYPVRGLQ